MKTLTFLALAVIALPLAVRAAEKCCQPEKPAGCAQTAPAAYTDKSLYQLDSTWTTDAAKPVKLGSLRGKPQVVAMFFASCQYTCPVIVHDLKRIAETLPPDLRTNVGFTLISFDSERDTPAALRSVRETRELTGDNWTLLRGEPDDVRELAALLGVNFRKDANGQFAHSNLITVLNAEGEIIFQQPGLNRPAEDIIVKLKAAIKP